MKLAVRGTLQEQTYQAFKNAIMAGEFSPGQPLTIRSVVEMFGTSVMPAREAVRRLTSEGALELLPNGTVRIRLLTSDELEQIRRIRMALEPMAIRQAVKSMSEPQLNELTNINEAMGDAMRSGDISASLLKNRDFHFSIYSCGNLNILVNLIEILWLQSGPFLRNYVEYLLSRSPKSACKESVNSHRRIVSALSSRDTNAAERAIKDEISSVSEYVRVLKLEHHG